MRYFSIHKQTDTKIGPLIQIISIIASLCIVFGATYLRMQKPIIKERYTGLSTFVPEDQAIFGEFAEKIFIGLYIDDFLRFDMNNNEYIFTGVLWFQFTPGATSFNTLEKFEFASGTILERSERFASLVDEKLLVRYNIKVSMSTLLDYSDFPFDGHRIHIVIQNKFVAPDQILFDSAQSIFTVNASAKAHGWLECGSFVKSGYKKIDLDKYATNETVNYPAVIFSIDYQRTGIRFLLSILLPLLLIFFIVMFSFSIKGTISVSTCTVGVTAMLGYRFVIENLSPKVGYFMRSDYMFLIALTLSSLTFIVSVVDNFVLPLSYRTKLFMYHLTYQLLNVAMLYCII